MTKTAETGPDETGCPHNLIDGKCIYCGSPGGGAAPEAERARKIVREIGQRFVSCSYHVPEGLKPGDPPNNWWSWLDTYIRSEVEATRAAALEETRERIAALEKALEEYGDHSGGCGLIDYYPNTGREARCTCGLWVAQGFDAFGNRANPEDKG